MLRDGEHWSVYAIEDGRARLRHLKLGRFGEHAAELREGLAEGAQVVLYPGDNVREGSRVARDALAR
jgi:HlyD family secretion protein